MRNGRSLQCCIPIVHRRRHDRRVPEQNHGRARRRWCALHAYRFAASSMYGIPRATNDIDIVIAPSRDQLFSLTQLFKRLGWYVTPFEVASAALSRETQFNVIDFANGWKVDLIFRRSRDFSVTEFDRRASVEAESWRLTIASPEDVLIAKLEWAKLGGSEQQLTDAAGILRIQRDRLDMDYIEKWVDALEVRAQWEAARARAV